MDRDGRASGPNLGLAASDQVLTVATRTCDAGAWDDGTRPHAKTCDAVQQYVGGSEDPYKRSGGWPTADNLAAAIAMNRSWDLCSPWETEGGRARELPIAGRICTLCYASTQYKRTYMDRGGIVLQLGAFGWASAEERCNSEHKAMSGVRCAGGVSGR